MAEAHPALFRVLRIRPRGTGRELLFNKPSLTVFLEDLAGCRAVIANSGFSLISESPYLGKPYLAIPVRHQCEQVLNAYYVDKMGCGTSGTS
jgi:uncharacterized protein (TIGR00661 family)